MGRRNLEKERYWREIAVRFERSGMKVRAFCEQEQIKEHQFFGWRRELKRRDADRGTSEDLRGHDSQSPTLRHDHRRNDRNDLQMPNTDAHASTSRGVAFAPLHVVASPPTNPSPPSTSRSSPPTGPSSIEIIVGDGRRVAVTPGFDPEALAQVLAVVEQHKC